MPDAPIRIRRVHHERDFTIIGNATLQDPEMSFKATGLLAYLLSLPADWRVNLTDLATRKAEGRDAVRSALNELEDLGYARRSQVRDETGRFVEWLVEVSEVRMIEDDDPVSGFPNVGLPDFGSPDVGKSNATKDPLPTKDSEEKEHTRQRMRIDPERCDLNEVARLWPRAGTQPHRLKSRWRTAKARAGGPMDLAIAVSAMIEAWDGATPEQIEFCPSLRTWLDEERYRESEQAGPRQDTGRPPSAHLQRVEGEPLAPEKVPRYYPDGSEKPVEVYEAEVEAQHEAWDEWERRPSGE